MTIPTKQEIYGLLGVFEIACTHGDMAAQFKTKGEFLDALASVFAELERVEQACLMMADDGWLYFGPEGMDEVQTAVWTIIEPLTKRRAALAAQERKP